MTAPVNSTAREVDHPAIVLMVREIEQARGERGVHPKVDAFYNATSFLLGSYGVLTTTDNPEARDTHQ